MNVWIRLPDAQLMKLTGAFSININGIVDKQWIPNQDQDQDHIYLGPLH